MGWRKGWLDKIWKWGVDNIGTLRQLCTNIDRKRVVSCYPSSVIFPSIFILPLCGSKNSIFNWVSKFNPSSTNSYFIAIVKVLFLTHYLLEKHFKEGYIFSVFFWNHKILHPLLGHYGHCTKMNFSIKDFFSKCDQIRSVLWIWSHLLKKFLMENFIFCAVRAFWVSLTKTSSNRKTHLLDKNSGKHKCLE